VSCTVSEIYADIGQTLQIFHTICQSDLFV